MCWSFWTCVLPGLTTDRWVGDALHYIETAVLSGQILLHVCVAMEPNPGQMCYLEKNPES